jgi:hypothetical protein
MLNDSIGGTLFVVANKDAACKIVPSPPKVVVRSTLSQYSVLPPRPATYIGNGSSLSMSCATVGSNMSETSG